MSYEIKSKIPEFGVDYDAGYTFFTMNDSSVVSLGIAYFTRWNRLSDIKVSHCGICTGLNEGVEATSPKAGKCNLTKKYFSNPNVHIFFRKPQMWSPRMGEEIATEALTHEGEKYAYALILGHLLANSRLGRAINTLTGRVPERVVNGLLDNPHHRICSELVADVYKTRMELRARGCLTLPSNMVKPQDLFEDPLVYLPWKNGGVA